jgi:hypothetical protein
MIREFSRQKTWVQSWVQLEGLFQPKVARKLRQINDSLIGYEPEGRHFPNPQKSARNPLLGPEVNYGRGSPQPGEIQHLY